MKTLFSILAGIASLATFSASAAGNLSTMHTSDAARGYEAVGRLNLGDSGFCTAALVAPDVVLTAAHCLYSKETGRPISVDQIEFQAGLIHGLAEATRGVSAAVTHPEYDFTARNMFELVGNDMALLKLDAPINMPNIKPFRTKVSAEIGDSVEVVSYAKGRADAPSLENDCGVLTRDADVFVLNCDVDFGASGAPIIVRQGGEAYILSVVSAKANWQDRPVALAATFEGDFAQLLKAYERNLRETLILARAN